jgi:hypothetical protein
MTGSNDDWTTTQLTSIGQHDTDRDAILHNQAIHSGIEPNLHTQLNHLGSKTRNDLANPVRTEVGIPLSQNVLIRTGLNQPSENPTEITIATPSVNLAI